MGRKILGLLIVASSLAFIGCPPPAPESINILDPLDLEAHNINLSTELASIQIFIDITSSSGRPLQVGSFQAFVTEDIPGVEPGDTDVHGNLIEQPIDITDHFTVNYVFRVASLSVPLQLPMGWYFLQAKVRDNLNVEASDLVVFSVDYPGPLFVGSTNSPTNSMQATVSGIYDECFGGILNGLWPEEGIIPITNVPTFQQIKSAPLGLPVNVAVPTVIDPSGFLTVTGFVVNNAIVSPATPIAPVDLGPHTEGLVPCEIGAQLMAVLRRTGPEDAAPRLVFQDVTLGDSPTGGHCWLPPPPAGCESVVDLEATAYYPPGG